MGPTVSTVDWVALRAAASAAMRRAYAPYSRFPVGAAGLAEDGRIVVGCNVENASYGLGLCAECGMVSGLHASGGGQLLAVSCVDGEGNPLMPCGRCRQLLWEHGGPDCLVDAADGPLRMADLLPHAFDLARGPAGPPAVRDDADEVAGPGPGLIEYLGRGTVFVHRDVVAGRPVWTGYWERAAHADEGAGILEEAPNWPEAAPAIAWGRARTTRVVVVDADGTLSWAGMGDPPAEIVRRRSE